MANDRIFVVCDWCGMHKKLGKYYPSTGAYINSSIFKAFHEEHRVCHPQHGTEERVGGPDLGPKLGISLMCETEFCEAGGIIGDSSPIPRRAA